MTAQVEALIPELLSGGLATVGGGVGSSVSGGTSSVRARTRFTMP